MINFFKVSFAADQKAFELFDEIFSLFKHHSKHSDGGVEQLITFIDRKFEEREDHIIEVGDILISVSLEEISIFAHVLAVREMFKRR